MANMPAPPIKGISLLFIKLDDIIDNSMEFNKYPNGLDVIYAIEDVCGRGKIEGAQRIGKLFRIYVKCEKARDKLAIEGFTFKGRHVSFHTRNPFTVNDEPDTVKIIIGGVPLSVANSEFERALLDLDINIISDIKFENYRDKDGKWTAYKTGRRFVYCKKPKLNLKPFIKIGLWNASLYYREQIRPNTQNRNYTESTVVSTQVFPNDSDSDSDTIDSRITDHSIPETTQVFPPDTASETNDLVNTDTTDRVIIDSVTPPSTNNEESQPITGNPSSPAAERRDDWPKTNAKQTKSQNNPSTGQKDRGRPRETNRLSNYFNGRSRRSQSSSSVKRKEMVSTKALPPPPKSAKNESNLPKYQKPKVDNIRPDWFENCESKINKT